MPAFKYPPRHVTVKILERKKTLKAKIKKVRQKKSSNKIKLFLDKELGKRQPTKTKKV